MAAHFTSIDDGGRDYLAVIRPTEKDLGDLAVKAFQVIGNPIIAGCAVIVLSAWLASGALSYQVGWKDSAKVHSPLSDAAPQMSDRMQRAMADIHEVIVRGESDGRFASAAQ